MKEDILEQLVEDWFVSKPTWFVKHNLKFRPSITHPDYLSKQDSVHSDIDILAISPKELGINRVAVVSCKSWQEGFKASDWRKILEEVPKYNSPTIGFVARERWKYFRELASDKWISSFIDKIEDETGQRDFQYYIAVTKLLDRTPDLGGLCESEIIKSRFRKHKSNINIKIITFEEIVNDIQNRLKGKQTPCLESTDVGRLLQLMAAADLNLTKHFIKNHREYKNNLRNAVMFGDDTKENC